MTPSQKTDFIFQRIATLLLAGSLACFIAPAAAQQTPDELPDGFDAANYQLTERDEIELTVYDEPDLSTEQRIDGRGQIRVPLLGTKRIAGMSVREAEKYLEDEYIENRILRSPMITIRVAEYAPKEVAVLGAVQNPGRISLPIEEGSVDIVDVISEVGGFTGIARSDEVRVTRKDENGGEVEHIVNVERMISGRGRGDASASSFEILPGDVIHVRERFF